MRAAGVGEVFAGGVPAGDFAVALTSGGVIDVDDPFAGGDVAGGRVADAQAVPRSASFRVATGADRRRVEGEAGGDFAGA